MNIPIIINYKTRTGLAVKYPLGKIEEVILQEGLTIIGTCGDCYSEDDCIIKSFVMDSFDEKPSKFGCSYRKEKEK